MNFIQIGNDPDAEQFVEVALSRGYQRVGYVPVPSDLSQPNIATNLILPTLEDISSLSNVDFLVLSGSYEGRVERLNYVLRLDPMNLIITTPLAAKPDAYYELSLMQGEAKTRVFPLIPEAGHLALELINALQVEESLGGVRWMEWTHTLTSAKGALRYLDGWTWVRDLGGDIETLSATGSIEPGKSAQVVVSARARTDLVSTSRWLSGSGKSARFVVELDNGRIDCDLPDGFGGTSIVRWKKNTGEEGSEEILPETTGERYFRRWRECLTADIPEEFWRLATRQIEIAEGVDRSLTKGRAVDLTYDEVTEEASFKSVMTIFGCSMVWIILLVAILAAAGVPYIGYTVLPALVLFACAQLLGLVFRKPTAE